MALPSAHIAFAITAGCCAALYISVYTLERVSRPHTISLSIDHTIAPHYQALCAHTIKNACSKTLPTAQHLAQLLNTIPLTHTITIKKMPGKVHITLCAQKPVVSVQCYNATCYITSQKEQQAPEWYNTWCYDNLPHITTPYTTHTLDTSRILQWAMLSDYELLRNYQTAWNSNHNIILTPLSEADFILATTSLQPITTHFYSKIKPLENMYKEKNYGKKIKKRWKADLRFSDRIIVSPYIQGIS